ncbi:hypothetical protein K458DRAFT_402577 [Lentithecium fluviatile CBS 122367]|uniref:Uncharacterized protein n=1 Tax=Lentithecium fluviatile CBS 122367 TaxID=1168545 RepID=A0A6G1J6A0_9PLEO|nr:hypothetical protein K458DRAFT_402577 [Lentithecium fluviatile CBS 122367]
MQHNTDRTRREGSTPSTASTTSTRPLPPPPSTTSAPVQASASANIVQQVADIQHLSYERRGNLANNPMLSIISGGRTFKIPIDVFRAVSSKASLVDHSDPSMPKFVLVPMHPGPTAHLLGWLKQVVTLQKAPYLNMLYNMKKDLAIVRVGKMLGIEYVQDIFNFYWRKFKKDKLTYEDIDVVLSLMVSKQDSFFVTMTEVARLRRLRRVGYQPPVAERGRRARPYKASS